MSEQMQAVDPVIIIEKNGQRVRSEVVWPEHSRVVTVHARLLDDAGEPLPPVAEGNPPTSISGSMTLQADEEYSDEQALHDIEIFRFRVATELAGHSHVRELRGRIGPHKKEVAEGEVAEHPVVAAPRVPRPEKVKPS